MTIQTTLLRAKHVGVRDLKEHLSSRLKERNPLIVTEHGVPTKVIFSYKDILELLEILDELQDRKTTELVLEGRTAIRKGAGGIPVSGLFEQIRRNR